MQVLSKVENIREIFIGSPVTLYGHAIELSKNNKTGAKEDKQDVMRRSRVNPRLWLPDENQYRRHRIFLFFFEIFIL